MSKPDGDGIEGRRPWTLRGRVRRLEAELAATNSKLLDLVGLNARAWEAMSALARQDKRLAGAMEIINREQEVSSNASSN